VSVVLVDPRTVAESVTDPELPMLTLADLGVLRDVRSDGDGGKVVVALTPTYTGCPAMDTMRDDLVHALNRAGYDDVEVRVVLSPAWTTDWISERGRRALAAAGIAPPGAVAPSGGPIPLTLSPTRRRVTCPWCGSTDTIETSRYGATACKSLHRCTACDEPFEHFKEH
jgi:ring-1,2-phenylacetyl-CoA epoxidase subunit PaaD